MQSGNDVYFGSGFAGTAEFYSVMLLQPTGSISGGGTFTSGSSLADHTDMSQSECTVVTMSNGNTINSCSPPGRCAAGSGGASPPSDCAPCVDGTFSSLWTSGTECESCTTVGNYCGPGAIADDTVCPAGS